LQWRLLFRQFKRNYTMAATVCRKIHQIPTNQ
jgi:hypothetical protein